MIAAQQQSVKRGRVHIIPVNVVHIAMAYSIPVHIGDGHTHLWSIEHGRLIHIVPDKQVRRRVLVLVKAKLFAPETSHLWIGKIRIPTIARPTPTRIVIAIAILDPQVTRTNIAMHIVRVILLNVWIDNGHHLASRRRDIVQHPAWIRKVVRVPRKIALAIRMFDIEPNHIVGHIERVKLVGNLKHFVHVVVVPTALMMAETE
mmetsp:Transcript_14761/g.22203  ORF Transcript_14761/g.22203 Transcript_14761/m.22203 type:complete len:203 (-) Transcript_14761:25-633(-)